MKKLSLFLSALLISIMSYAGTVTFEVGQDKLEGHTQGTAAVLTKDGVTLDVSKGAFGRDDNFRIYAGFGMTISCEYGNITGVEITCTAAAGGTQYGPDFFTTSVGSYTYADKVGTWTGDEASVSFSATKQVRFTKLVVTYASSDANFVSQPMITGDLNFADTANVVITADEGMKIYYTLDGTDPTTASTEYIAPFEVYATTTVKAIAYNETTAVSSMISETVFTQATKVPCAEAAAIAKALSNNTETTELYYNVKGYVTSLKDTFNTSTSKQQFWIADTKTGGEVLYAYNNQVPCAMEVGMKVRIVGKLKQWNTGQYIQPQIVNAEITVLAPAPKIYTVSASAENGTVAGAGQYEEGTQATLTATAAEGYEFVNWTVADSVVSTENPYTFAVTADIALVANFEQAAPATETVYFINTKKWSAVKAHAWGGKAAGTAWPGLATVKETEQIAGFDVYSFTADAGAYANVIFNNNNGGSQTADLVWTAGKYYVMDMGWLTKEEAEEKLATPIPDVWTVVGAKGLLGTDWNLNDANNNMTLQEDGTYQLVKTDLVLAAGNYDYKAAKDHGWTVAVPQSGNQTLKITTSGTYDVVFVLNVSTKKLTATATLKQEEVIIPTIAIAGDMNDWSQTANEFVMAADSLTATATIKLAAKTYEFKMVVGGNWQSDAKTINRENNSTVFTGANSDTNTKLVVDQAGDYIFTWEYETKTLTVTYPKLPAKPEVVTEMVGVVKRAIQNGDNTIVLTHEADGTAHIYELANGTILELVQEGIIPVDTTNLGDYLAISDIALTEDGKLVATNKIVCQASDNEVDAGYKRGELRAYIWNDLHDVPSLWFTSKMSSNWYRSVQGQTIAYKGTSTNGTLFTTGVTATGVKFRYSVYNVIDGVYTDPAVNDSEHFHFTKGSAQTTDVLGANYQLVASPLAATNWILDGELVEPFEIVDPLTYNTEVTANPALAIDLGKKYNGTSIVTVGEQHLMVAPYATAEGLLAGVKVLDITTGLAAATEVATADLDAAVEATAAATAVAVAENTLTITLVADAAVYNLTATLAEPIEYVDITMTNMVATDMGTYTLVEASDDMTAIGVALAIDAEGKLVEGSTVDWYGTDMPIVSSEVFTKTYSEELASDVYTGKLVIDFMGGLMGLNLTMYTIPVETIEVTIENAEVVVDLDWSELSYAANWTYEDVTYPVSVLLYGYDEEETEFEGMQIAELQIGGDGDDDPWLDYAVAEAVTVTKAGNVITLKGEFSSYATGNIYELTISGEEVKSSVDNIQLNVESVKLIRNNQLIIRKDGREYNAQGATIQ